MPVQMHTAYFRKSDGEVVSAEVITFSDHGADDIKAAFADNSFFIGITSPDQTVDENEATLRKVSSPVLL